MKNINVKNKAKNTFISRYGVDHPMKFEKFFDKAQKSSYKHFIYESSDLKYQGSYELDFIKICLHNNLNIKNGPVIDYTMSDKSRKYYSDFYLPDFNLICEIKSTYTFNCDYDENIAKQKFAIKSGYNFIFIIDKKYNEFENITCKNSL
jgi:hypothetical protein